MNIERIGAYLAGSFPPYYKPFHKFCFIEELEGRSKIFNDEVFCRIQKYTRNDEQFYTECLMRLEKYDKKALYDFIEHLNIPNDVTQIVIWEN